VGCGFAGKKGRIGGDVSRKKRKEKKRKKNNPAKNMKKLKCNSNFRMNTTQKNKSCVAEISLLQKIRPIVYQAYYGHKRTTVSKEE
jgi:hypothetical protein